MKLFHCVSIVAPGAQATGLMRAGRAKNRLKTMYCDFKWAEVSTTPLLESRDQLRKLFDVAAINERVLIHIGQID